MDPTIATLKSQLGEINPDGKRCGNCVHFQTHQPGNWRIRCPENRNYGSWCEKLELTTCVEMLRCGGDDYERRVR